MNFYSQHQLLQLVTQLYFFFKSSTHSPSVNSLSLSSSVFLHVDRCILKTGLLCGHSMPHNVVSEYMKIAVLCADVCRCIKTSILFSICLRGHPTPLEIIWFMARNSLRTHSTSYFQGRARLWWCNDPASPIQTSVVSICKLELVRDN